MNSSRHALGDDSAELGSRNKATVLSSGEWILPVVHALEPLAGWAGFDPKQVFGAAVSTDEGKTWNLHGAVKTEKAGLENMIVELKNMVKSRQLGMNRGGPDAATSAREPK